MDRRKAYQGQRLRKGFGEVQPSRFIGLARLEVFRADGEVRRGFGEHNHDAEQMSREKAIEAAVAKIARLLMVGDRQEALIVFTALLVWLEWQEKDGGM